MPQFTEEQIQAMPIGEWLFYDRVGWETKYEDVTWSYRYDVFYNNKTGEILEDICRCKPGECQFTDHWHQDSSPTHVDLNNTASHEFNGAVIEI